MRRLAIGAGLVLTAVAVLLFVLLSQTEVARALRQGSPVAVLVVGVADLAEEKAPADRVSIALLQPGGRATWLSVPRDLAWPTAGGWTSLHRLYAGEGAPGLARRLASLLEIPIPYWIVLDLRGAALLVDRLGGVELVVPERLVYQDRAKNLFIDIPPGKQVFDGARAADFLRYRDDGEPEGARLARYHQLLGALLERAQALPPSGWREVVDGLRAEARTNLSRWETWDLARAVGGLSPDRTTFLALPTVPRTGGDHVPDLARLRNLVLGATRGQTALTRDEVRVLVLNGTGTRLLASRTGAWLSDLGFTVVGVGEADRSNYPRSYVVVREEARAKGRLLVEALPPAIQPTVLVQTDREFDVARVGGWPAGADVILILGAGFDVRS
ncbi:MAG: LCP family protein [Candidatus Bipolaricaulota bacterium]|nr:LCP family protein [Candidatus Bipolaricaulota bacterium]